MDAVQLDTEIVLHRVVPDHPAFLARVVVLLKSLPQLRRRCNLVRESNIVAVLGDAASLEFVEFSTNVSAWGSATPQEGRITSSVVIIPFKLQTGPKHEFNVLNIAGLPRCGRLRRLVAFCTWRPKAVDVAFQG